MLRPSDPVLHSKAEATVAGEATTLSIVFCITLAVLIGVVSMFQGRELEQDAPQYLIIARNVIEGKGYRNTFGPWGDAPACDRMPVWPIMLVGVLLIKPAVLSDEMAVRLAGSVCLALVGVCFARISRQVGVRSRLLQTLAGLGVGLSPPLVFIAVSGMSEVSFLLLVAVGLSCLLQGQRWGYVGAISLGLATLVRTNFAVFPILFGVAMLCRPSGKHSVTRRYSWKMLAVFFVLAMMPISLWTVRNYFVTGVFPLLSTIEGETLWGSNNPVAAHDLQAWGSWIMPDGITGETKKSELIIGRTEMETGKYYHDKAVAWISSNWREMPRLLLGKLVRAFVPIPWVPLTPSFIAFGYRFVLDVLVIVTISWWWRAIDRLYLYFVAAMLGSLLMTTLVYYGNYRFTHCMFEVFFVPCVGLGVQQWMEFKKARLGERRRGGSMVAG